jgi:hypothetical protein
MRATCHLITLIISVTTGDAFQNRCHRADRVSVGKVHGSPYCWLFHDTVSLETKTLFSTENWKIYVRKLSYPASGTTRKKT